MTLGKETFTNDDTQTNTTEFPGVWLVEFTGSTGRSNQSPAADRDVELATFRDVSTPVWVP